MAGRKVEMTARYIPHAGNRVHGSTANSVFVLYRKCYNLADVHGEPTLADGWVPPPPHRTQAPVPLFSKFEEIM